MQLAKIERPSAHAQLVRAAKSARFQYLSWVLRLRACVSFPHRSLQNAPERVGSGMALRVSELVRPAMKGLRSYFSALTLDYQP